MSRGGPGGVILTPIAGLAENPCLPSHLRLDRDASSVFALLGPLSAGIYPIAQTVAERTDPTYAVVVTRRMHHLAAFAQPMVAIAFGAFILCAGVSTSAISFQHHRDAVIGQGRATKLIKRIVHARLRHLLVVALPIVAFAQCTAGPQSMKRLEFLTRDGCAQTATMRVHLDEAIKTLDKPVPYVVVDLDLLAPTDVRKAYPTPTVLYGGADLFGMPEPKPPLPEPT